RDPTRYVTFTVTFGFDESGNSSTRRPFGKSYSVSPSTDGPFCTPGGSGWAARQEARAKRAIDSRKRIPVYMIRDGKMVNNLMSRIVAITALVSAYMSPIAANSDQVLDFVKQSCAGCHNASVKSGGLDLTAAQSAKTFEENRGLWEKVASK